MDKKRIAKEVVAWLLTLFVCVIFFRAGIMKFDDASGWSRAFRNWGFPDWFRVFIGVLEVAAAVLILIPRVARYGAVIVAVVMLGAIVTQLLHHRPHPAAYQFFIIGLVLFYLRRPARPPALPQ